MATVRHLGLIPNFCYPEQDQVTWKQILIGSEVIELGAAPESAYLKLTKQQVAFFFWRVKEWEVTWGWDNKSISTNVIAGVGGAEPITQTYEFSYPSASWSKTLISPHMLGALTEKTLVCRSWNGVVPTAFFEFNEFSITSTETSVFGDPPETFDADYSRNSIINRIEFYSSLDIPLEGGIYEFDVAWVPNYETGLFYWPFTINFDLEISNISSDNLLFDEEVEDTSGALPPIRGKLTSNNLGDNSLPTSPYVAKLYLSGEDFIEIPLFDITEPSPETNTRFNLDGFTGIDIRPKLYWPYDPNDGDGPIYDSATGEQLRPFPN
jgi:hypothetical protein